MDTVNTTTVETIIKESLHKGMSYQDYRTLVEQKVAQNSSTGLDQSQEYADYTSLNDRRMRRWDKTLKISEDVKARLHNFTGKVTWLVLSESWCGDAAHVVPVISKVAELNENIELKIVLRDDNEELMNEFLTNGGKSIPKLIMIDSETHTVLNTFGPRPAVATKLVADHKAAHGMILPEFKEELQVWYNTDKGQSTIEDLLNLLAV